MRAHCLLFSVLVLACVSSHIVEAKTAFRRTDRFRENYKKLDLPQEEIDPNVAPPEPQKIEITSPEEDGGSGIIGTAAPAVADEIIEEAEDVASTVASIVNEVVDEAANEVVAAEIGAVATTVAPVVASTPVKEDTNPISKYCKCTETSCDCCRTIGLPLLPVRGPGCAKLTYLGKEKMSVSLKYGDITLASRTISGKRARPICVGLPGGESEFCGRVYGLAKGKEDFKACLGFELRNDDEVQAALRVSCFKFGPQGLRIAEAEPLPSEVNKEEDDDDDIFGFGAGGDDDDYEEDEDDEPDDEDDEEEVDDVADTEDDDPEAPEEADYGGFSLAGLLEELADDEDEKPAAAATPIIGLTPTAVDETRTGDTADQKDVLQSKDDKGTASAATAAEEDGSDQSPATATAAEEATVVAEQQASTTVKSKKAKKAKKNKKKKAADTESDFAFQILNGILDFFN